MHLGLGLKIGRPPPHALFVWDFTQQSAGALVLPTGLTFARASSGYTVQTGTSTIVTSGITSNDIGRIGRLSDSHSRGLFIEPARTNVYGYANTPSLASGTAASSGSTFTTGRTGPDGAATATRVQQTSGTFSRYHSITTAGASTPYTLSAWLARGLGTGAYLVCAPYAGTTGAAITGTAGASWSRASNLFTYPSTSGANLVGEDGRANTSSSASAGARDVDLAYIQFEAGKYATSPIITSGGSSATRAAERLTIDSTRCTRALVGGRLGVYLRFRALAAVSELGSADGQILFGVGSGGSIRLAASGYIYADDPASAHWSETATSTVSWSRGDLVEIATEIGAGKFRFSYRVNGGSVVTPALTRDETFDALVLTSGLDVLCAGTSWQMPSILEVLSFFVPWRAPF